MKLERLHEYITSVVVISLGIGFALYCGLLTGRGETAMVAVIFLVSVGVAVGIGLNKRIWLLLPFSWLLTGRVLILPIPFTVRDLCVIFVFATTLLLVALKTVRRQPKWDLLDVLLWANILYVASEFLRNPVGLNVMHSNRIGGRDYFNVVVGIMAYMVLSRVAASPSQARMAPILTVVGTAIVAVLSVLTFSVPSTVPYIGQFYSGIAVGNYLAIDIQVAATVGEVTDRIDTLMFFGQTSFLALCSYYRPITLLIPAYFGRSCGLILSVAATLYSGFRSLVFLNGAMFILSSYFRGRIRECVFVAIFALPVVGIILTGQGRAFQLPLAAQRALSFLPANWNYEVKQQAEGSTEWRVGMWKLALTTDKYIQDKVFGDGFGYSQEENQAIIMASGPNAGWEAGLEDQMVVGGFHSGPISAIRFVGVVGMILYYILIIYVAVRAYRLIRSASDTPLFAPVLFVGLPLFFHPFYYTVIFGAYPGGIVETIYGVGMLKALNYSLENYGDDTKKVAQAAQPSPTQRPRRHAHLAH